MAITPDGTHAYVTNEWSDRVSVIAIDQAPTLLGTAPAGTVGQSYRHVFGVTGQPTPTVTVTGALPDGLTVSIDGVLSGTPTVGGRFEFTLTASNGIGQDAALPVVPDITDTAPPATGSLGSLNWTS
ncbi:hypothetical protein [Prescottella agglutinans]|uniref:DNA-binding beta-propeller fold protein YncE n=1 Tax=Prescottella agglutinans TaxID=1644129 RepID=A0ABT6MLP3_9NOCA|nr:hypothetical protein [Prescottella agglutinans]MDH6284915.1 DNA-binding beta-propeller fold protein YncE [Prescottella agglutinans]